MTENSTAPQDISLSKIIQALWISKWWIILFTVIALIVSFVAYTKLPKTYRAEAIVMPADSGGGGQLSGSVAGLAALAGVNLENDSSSMEEAVAILESSRFIREFITDEIPLSLLFEDRWDAQVGDWNEDAQSNPPTLNDAEYFFSSGILTIRRLPKGQALLISITWSDRIQAAEWANKLIARINETMRQRALVSAQESLSYLEAELERVNVLEVRQGIFSLIEDQVKRVMLANVKPQYAFKIIDPAVAPDEDDHHSPRLVMLILGGVFFGGVIGAMFGLLLSWRAGRL